MMPLEINGKPYLTTAEVAQQLGVTPGRVRQLIMDGQITDVIKFSNRSLVSAAEVSTYQRQPRGRRLQSE